MTDNIVLYGIRLSRYFRYPSNTLLGVKEKEYLSAMSFLDEISNRMPSGLLYHYTNQEGLLGIVNNKEIWASHTQYLNDSREYVHASDLVKSVIEDAKSRYKKSIELEILNEMSGGISGFESMNICVCSFSEEADSLPQWRAYGGSSGYSIGFSAPFLKNVISSDKHKFYLAPCIYEESEQVSLLNEVIDRVIQQNIGLKKDGTYKDFPKGGNLVATMHRYAPMIKDKSFREEREWRIITRPLSCTFEQFDFRKGKSMLIPYYKIPLVDESGLFNIEDIVVGPNPNMKWSKASTRSFLVRHKIKYLEPRETSVPYRDW